VRKRKDYRLPPRPAHVSEVGRPKDLVVNFLGPTGTLVQTLDFSEHMGRPRLMADLAFALRHHLADKRPAYRQAVPRRLACFFRFLEQHDPARKVVLSAQDVSSATLRAYIAWFDAQRWSKASRSSLWTTLKVALAWLQRRRPDLVQPGLELPANAFPRRYADARPLPALAREEIEAVLAACRVDIEASWADFQHGHALMAAAAHNVDAAGKASVDDLRDLGVLLVVATRRYSGILPEQRLQAPGDEMHGKVQRAIKTQGGLKRVCRFLHATPDTIVPYMVAIAAQTFANPDALRTMRRDCMSEDLLLEGRVHVTWDKGRAGRAQRRSFLRNRSMSVPNLIDRVLALTAPLVPHAPLRDRDKLFLWGDVSSSRRVCLATRMLGPLQRLVDRHALVGRDGQPLRLVLAFLRPTGLTLAHAALGHDVTRTQALANHADQGTTRRYVAQPVIQAEQAAGLARLQGRFVEAVRSGKGLVKQAGQVDEAVDVDARSATASGFICSDPLSGIAPGQRKGRLCTAWLGCFTCPNAVIPLEADTLAQLIVMRMALADARTRMSLDRWQLLYAPKLEILERDILPRFPASVHAVAGPMVGQVPPPPPIE